MKRLFQAGVFVILYLLLSACGETSQVTSAPGATLLPTITSRPAAITTTPEYIPPIVMPTIDPTLAHRVHTPIPEYVPPTLIPTIDPTRVPDRLSRAFSIQALEGPNGHTVRKIAGWEFGFGNTMYPYYCPGHSWLDPSHLLLYPVTGQKPGSDGWGRYNLVPQPVVINLETGAVWLPPVQTENYGTCHKVYSAPELGILIHEEKQGDTFFVSTYTYDGHKLASYPGSIIDISPSGTKILLEQDTLLDLRTDRRITLDWSLEDYNQFDLTGLFWTSDEKRAYRCCYFYADLTTGVSHRFERSDFQFADGTHLDPDGLWFHRGEWIRNDTYFLAEWSMVDDGDIRYLPMFDPATKLFYDVRKLAGISDEWSAWETDVSPDGSQLWMTGYEGSYLINLFTYESRFYPDLSTVNMDWSTDSQYVWLYRYDNPTDTRHYSILSLTKNEIKPFPIQPSLEWTHWWQEDGEVLIYPANDESSLVFLDLSDMSFRQLSFDLGGSADYFDNASLAWSPDGKKIALIARNGSLWQVDYPGLENLQPLTASLPDAKGAEWSPDGSSISLYSGSDIYIVDTMK